MVHERMLTLEQTRAAKGFLILSVFFFVLIVPIERIAARESEIVRAIRLPVDTGHFPDVLQHPRLREEGLSAREQLKRRGSF